MSATTSTTDSSPPGIEDVAVEELRFAGVLNGGVSLAVWMGGVAHELNRLTWSPLEDPVDEPVPGSVSPSIPGSVAAAGTDYRHVLRASRTRAIVDVLAGTSAGGINGGALALAQVNADADLSVLRDLWSEQGRMMALLRTPFQGEPTSLLRGDDYFLPELHAAMTRLARAGTTSDQDRCRPTGRRVDLIVPTTLLDGWTRETPDAYGHLMRQQEHTGSLVFHLDDTSNLARSAPEIALASRASAGFPFAFEPTLLPVGGDSVGAASAPLRPDLTEAASWAGGASESRTRWAIDGGVLANTPTRQALALIEQRGVNGPVRRLMLLVFPHASQSTTEVSVDPASPPTVVDTANGLFAALRSQGSLTFAQEIDDHNRRVGAWRGGREDVLISCGGPDGLYDLVRAGWPAYRRLRRRVAAESLAHQVTRADWSFERVRQEALRAQESAERLGYVPTLPPPHLSALHPGAVGGGTSTSERMEAPPTSWVWGPTVALGVVDLVADVLRRALSVSRTGAGESLGARGADRGERARLTRGREELAAIRAETLRVLSEIDAPWREPTACALAPTATYWRARLVALRLALGSSGPPSAPTGSASPSGSAGATARPDQPDRPNQPDERTWVERDEAELRAALDRACSESDLAPLAHDDPWLRRLHERRGAAGRSLSDLVWRAARVLLERTEDPTGERLLDLVRQVAGEGRGRFVGLTAWAPYLDLDHPVEHEPAAEHETERLLLRLLAIDAGTWLVASADSTGNNLPIDLVQLDLSVPHAWARYSRTPDDKVAGLSVGRFGGFLKRSWRINDWTWGRLDAATMLCSAALDPDRLLRIHRIVRDSSGDAHTCDAACATRAALATVDVLDAAYGTAPGPDVEPLRTRMRAAAVHELEGLYANGTVGARRLDAVAAYAALPVQWRIVLEELPHLREAIEADRIEGQNARSRGELFLLQQRALLDHVQDRRTTVPWQSLGMEALEAFDRAGIGREDVTTEAGSDALIQTVATAAGVGITLLDSPGFGVAAIRPVTRTVRGAALLPFWMVRGLTSGGALARSLAVVGLAVGGVLLVLGLLGALGSWSASGAAIGIATLLAAFGYGALRTGSLLHGLVLLWPLPPLLTLAGSGGAGGEATSAAVTVAVVLAIVAGLAFLGSLPHPLRSPAAVVSGWRHRHAVQRRRREESRPGLRVRGSTGPVPTGLVPTIVVLAVAAGLVALAVVGLSWLQHLVTTASGWVALGLAVLTAAAAPIAWWRGTEHGRRLRLWVETPVPRGDVLLGPLRPVCSQVAHPAGVAAAWSSVYGVAALLLALGMIGLRAVLHLDGLPEGERGSADLVVTVAVGWSTVLGLLLALGGADLIGRRTWRTIEQQVLDQLADVRDEQRLVDGLRAHRLLYDHLVVPRAQPVLRSEPTDPGPDSTGALPMSAYYRTRFEWLELTPAGRRLLTRLRAATPAGARQAGSSRSMA